MKKQLFTIILLLGLTVFVDKVAVILAKSDNPQIGQKAQILKSDEYSGLVYLSTIKSKVGFLFRVSPQEIHLFPEGMTEFSVRCEKDDRQECNRDKSYQFFVRNQLQKVELWKFESPVSKVGWVHHGPGDLGENQSGFLIIEIRHNDSENGEVRAVFDLQAIGGKSAVKLNSVRRYDKVDLDMINDEPGHLFVNGVKMRIVALAI